MVVTGNNLKKIDARYPPKNSHKIRFDICSHIPPLIVDFGYDVLLDCVIFSIVVPCWTWVI